MRKYIVETKDAKWIFATRREIRRIDKGMITIRGKAYTIDPTEMRWYPVRPWRYLGLIKQEIQVQVYREDNPEPVPRFDHKPREDGLTGEIVAIAAREHRIREVLSSGMDMMTILLILSIMGNIILGVGLFYLQQNGGV